jgi:hypothetical protein
MPRKGTSRSRHRQWTTAQIASQATIATARGRTQRLDVAPTISA